MTEANLKLQLIQRLLDTTDSNTLLQVAALLGTTPQNQAGAGIDPDVSDIQSDLDDLFNVH